MCCTCRWDLGDPKTRQAAVMMLWVMFRNHFEHGKGYFFMKPDLESLLYFYANHQTSKINRNRTKRQNAEGWTFFYYRKSTLDE